MGGGDLNFVKKGECTRPVQNYNESQKPATVQNYNKFALCGNENNSQLGIYRMRRS